MRIFFVTVNFFLLFSGLNSQEIGNRDAVDDLVDEAVKNATANSNPNDFDDDILNLIQPTTTTTSRPVIQISNERVCGVKNVVGRNNGVTDTGVNAESGEFTWMMNIIRRGKDSKCGGALIHPSVVLTTSHCVEDLLENSLEVRSSEANPVKREVLEIVMSPYYNRGSLTNNIALLILRSPMPLNDKTNVICLPAQNLAFEGNCLLSGWSKNQNSLQKIAVPIMPEAECETNLKSYLGNRFNLHDSHMCAGGKTMRDICRGTSLLLIYT